MDRIWWNDESRKEELSLRVATGRWYVISKDTSNDVVLPGKVIKVIYAGYRIRNCRGVECIINPEKLTITDVLLAENEDIAQHEQYQLAVQQFEVQEASKQKAIDERNRVEQEKLDFQQQCPHSEDDSGLVVSKGGGPGCDVSEYSCATCQKFLRRTYATAYDNDPEDDIGDVDWWARYCRKHFQPEPPRFVQRNHK